MTNEQKPKQKLGFTIIKDDPTDGHKGFGIGSLSLENVSPVIVDIDEEEARIEIGAMHARSDTERGVKFTTNREDSEGGKRTGSSGSRSTLRKKAPTMPALLHAK